jgi:hypothetical protein
MEGFTCISCKRYFSSIAAYSTGLGNDPADGGEDFYYCAFCDRKGGNNPKNLFYWDEKYPWPYPEDLAKFRKSS